MRITKGSKLFPGDYELYQDDDCRMNPPGTAGPGIISTFVAVAIALVFALHPSVTAYHTGLAGYLVAAIFVPASVIGAIVPRVRVLAIVILLAFVEPEIAVTNTLTFNIASNGLLIGAVVAWVFDRPQVEARNAPLLLALTAFAFMVVALPVAFGARGWIHVHDALMIGKYVIVVMLAMSLPVNRQTGRSISTARVVGSFAVAAFTVLMAFRVPMFNKWVFSTYLASRGLSDSEITRMAIEYTRAFGVAGAVGTSVLLSLSIGAWFALLIEYRRAERSFAIFAGLLVVMFAIFLTGSRLGMLATFSGVALAVVWWFRMGRPGFLFGGLGRVALVLGIFTAIALAANPSLRQVAITSDTRVVQTVPNLIKGTPDPSFAQRLAEYKGVEINPVGNPGERNTQWTGEPLVLLTRFGIPGLLLVWQIWVMLFTRANRAADSAPSVSGRLFGLAASIGVLAAVVVGLGTRSILEPSQIVPVLALAALAPVVQMVPGVSRAYSFTGTVQPER